LVLLAHSADRWRLIAERFLYGQCTFVMAGWPSLLLFDKPTPIMMGFSSPPSRFPCRCL